MHAQKLPREFARHAAAFMTAEVYVKAIATLSYRRLDTVLTYGKLRFSFSLQPTADEEDEGL
eukprot:493985-Amphidinium_carterae.1